MTHGDTSLETILRRATKAYDKLKGLEQWAQHDQFLRLVLEHVKADLLDVCLNLNQRVQDELGRRDREVS